MILRKLFFVYGSMIAVLLFFATTTTAHAAEQTIPEIPQRYAGEFVVEYQEFNHYLWYIDPTTATRMAVKSGDDLSRLLMHVGVNVHTKDLQRIPAVDATIKNPDYALVNKYKGTILLNLDDNSKAWYVDPMTGLRYYLASGVDGFVTAQKLALDIQEEHVNQIPITQDLGFNDAQYAKRSYNEEIYKTMFSLLRSNHLYKDSFTDDDLFYGSLKGMAEGTKDPYTLYFDPQQNIKQRQTFFDEQTLEGIGVVLNNSKEKKLYIVEVLDETPAAKAGLKSLDQITAIDGTPSLEMPVESAVTLIKGPAGTKVTLTVFRPSNQTILTVTIAREKITVPTVESKILDDGKVAYFRMNIFNTSLVPEFDAMLKAATTPNLKGIIIDLRNNPGGLTSTAAQLADYWLSDKQVIFAERSGGLTTEFMAGGGKLIPDVPTVILTNAESASSSEIFVAALKNYHLAKIVGTTTYGKGTGQSLINFEDGSSLRYSTFEWLPPDGKSINKVGIEPDIIVEAGTTSDTQLEKAESLILSGAAAF